MALLSQQLDTSLHPPDRERPRLTHRTHTTTSGPLALGKTSSHPRISSRMLEGPSDVCGERAERLGKRGRGEKSGSIVLKREREK